jgi:hypothetical protein
MPDIRWSHADAAFTVVAMTSIAVLETALDALAAGPLDGAVKTDVASLINLETR